MNQIMSIIKKYALVLLGCVMYAVGFVAFIKPAGITSSGVTGFVNVINIIHPINIGFVILCINIPLIIVSLIKLKWKFTLSTIIGVVLSSQMITLCEHFLTPTLPWTHDVWIACVLGGAVMGSGLGLIMRNGSSTGGADVIVKVLHQKWRYLSGGTLGICLNVVVLLGFLMATKDLDATVHAAIAIVVSNSMYDLMLYGYNTSKTVYIITDKADELRTQLLERCECGATILKAQGAYTHNEKQVVLCVVRNAMYPILKDIINDVDPTAFVIVSRSGEIYGKGYKTYKDVL